MNTPALAELGQVQGTDTRALPDSAPHGGPGKSAADLRPADDTRPLAIAVGYRLWGWPVTKCGWSWSPIRWR